MNPYSQESQAEQEARRAEDLEILRRARQKRPQPEPETWWGGKRASARDAWFGLLLLLVIVLAVALFIPGGGR